MWMINSSSNYENTKNKERNISEDYQLAEF